MSVTVVTVHFNIEEVLIVEETKSLVTVDDDSIPRADSREIAQKLGITHRSFFALILKYQEEIEEDFGSLRFEIAVKLGNRGGAQPRYARLTEDQTYAYLTYSDNTPQARACKREYVKAFSKARDIIRTLQYAPEADLTDLTARQVRMVGYAAQMLALNLAEKSYDHVMKLWLAEAEAMTPEDGNWHIPPGVDIVDVFLASGPPKLVDGQIRFPENVPQQSLLLPAKKKSSRKLVKREDTE